MRCLNYSHVDYYCYIGIESESANHLTLDEMCDIVYRRSRFPCHTLTLDLSLLFSDNLRTLLATLKVHTGRQTDIQPAAGAVVSRRPVLGETIGKMAGHGMPSVPQWCNSIDGIGKFAREHL